MPYIEVTKIEIIPMIWVQRRCLINILYKDSGSVAWVSICRALERLTAPTMLSGRTMKKSAWANSIRYKKAKTTRTVLANVTSINSHGPATRAIPNRRFTLTRTMSIKSCSVSPPFLRARWIRSYGTPNTQWLTDDHSTAMPIQYQRLEKDRISMTSKRASVQFTGGSLVWCYFWRH